MQKNEKKIWDSMSYQQYSEIFDTSKNTLIRHYSDKETLYNEAVRRGKLSNVLNINIKTLTPLIFKNEIEHGIVIKKSKVNNTPTQIKRTSVKDILLMNENDEFQELDKLLNNNEISDEDFNKKLKLIQKKNMLNCMKFLSYISSGKIKTYKYLENYRKFALDYQESYFRAQNLDSDPILEKKTTKTATFKEEVQEIFKP